MYVACIYHRPHSRITHRFSAYKSETTYAVPVDASSWFAVAHSLTATTTMEKERTHVYGEAVHVLVTTKT